MDQGKTRTLILRARRILVLAAGLQISVANAQVASASPPAEIVAALFQDAELVSYVCADRDGKCSAVEFGGRLEGRSVDIKAPSAQPVKAILVEPVRKHRQYFSAIFVKEGTRYREIYSADLSFSGTTILPSVRNGYFMVQGVVRDSNAYWKEVDFIYDSARKYYWPEKTRCFQDVDGEISMREC